MNLCELQEFYQNGSKKKKKTKLKVKLIFHFSKDRGEFSLLIQCYKSLTQYPDNV